MIKVKSFTTEMQVFQTRREIEQLDAMVNKFIESQGIKKVISISDACTTDDQGSTMGIIRVIAYE